MIGGTPESWHQNWKDESGPCNGCDLCAKARPQGGAINFDADLALVNNTPGLGDQDKSGENRERLELEEREDLPGTHYDGYDDAPDHVDDPYTWLLLNKWGALDQIKDGVFNHQNMNFSLEDAYYTNSLKCPKTDNDMKEYDGRIRCSQYLRSELCDVVEPDVVVTGGPSATKSVFYALDIDISTPGTFARLIDSPEDFGGHTDLLHGAYGESIIIIPTYQFGNLFRNWSQPSWVDNKKDGGHKTDYFARLVERINHHL
jgi:uracil-DNA glycosylase